VQPLKNSEDIAWSIGTTAFAALLEELYTTPKPGLVDLYSCGAHQDMNDQTFEKSAAAIRPFLTEMAAQGYLSGGTPEELFLAVRKTGLAAEQAMYEATDGVNTHKGLIFSLGIFCAAAGRCIREGTEINYENLVSTEKQMTYRILLEELEQIKKRQAVSHGEILLKQYNTWGIRGEAIRGYPSVTGLAVPVMQKGTQLGKDWNLVKLQTLLVLMSSVEDSNILARHNPAVLSQVHSEAAAFLKAGGAYAAAAVEQLRMMDRDYIRRNISAGGCADLLAITIFFELLMKKDGLSSHGMKR